MNVLADQIGHLGLKASAPKSAPDPLRREFNGRFANSRRLTPPRFAYTDLDAGVSVPGFGHSNGLNTAAEVADNY